MEEKCPNFFMYTIKSLKKVRVIIFSFIPGYFSFISNAMKFFIHSLNRFVLKKKKAYGLLVFFNWVPYMSLSHMILGVNIIGRKMSVVSINGAGGYGGVLRTQRGPQENF